MVCTCDNLQARPGIVEDRPCSGINCETFFPPDDSMTEHVLAPDSKKKMFYYLLAGCFANVLFIFIRVFSTRAHRAAPSDFSRRSRKPIVSREHDLELPRST